jgi:hypothetical protein
MHSNFDKSQAEGMRRDPEDRPAHSPDEHREKMLDKALADTFPTSDPPSTSNPDEGAVDSKTDSSRRELLMGLPAGSWAAISLEDQTLAGTGSTRDEAEQDARNNGVPNVELVEVSADSDAPLQAPDAA